jgi:hypothetical protein
VASASDEVVTDQQPGAPWRGGRIRIGVSTPKRWNPLSPILRRIMRTRYSHIWVLLDDALFDVDMVLGTEKQGFQLIPYDRFLKSNDVIMVYDPDPSYHLDVGLRAVAPLIGEPYDGLGLVGMAWVMFGRWLKRKFRNPLANPKALFCSESVAMVLVKSAVPEAAMLVPERATPEDVVSVLDGMKLAK